MNQPNASIRCPQCNLVNFASEAFCKRCKNSLPNAGFSADTNSININISFPNGVQPRVNARPNNYQQQQQPFVQPNQSSLANSEDSSEFQLQNQTGFQQWQQNQPPLQLPDTSYHQPAYSPVYAPPGYPAMPNGNAVWQRGSELVIHRYAGGLPDTCVKCGEQIGGYAGGAYIRQKFRWHNPLVYIALISPLIYCILAAALSERVKIDIPLCQKHIETRKSTGKMLLGGGIGALAAIFFFGSFGYVGFSFLIFLAAFIGIILGYEYNYKPLQISKIESDYVYLKNADNRFLSRLPRG